MLFETTAGRVSNRTKITMDLNQDLNLVCNQTRSRAESIIGKTLITWRSTATMVLVFGAQPLPSKTLTGRMASAERK